MTHFAAPTTAGAVSITDQTQTYRVLIANAISHRGRDWADFDTAEQAFEHFRAHRYDYNNCRAEAFKIVGYRDVEERVYREPAFWSDPGRKVIVNRPLIAHLDLNDMTTIDDLINLGA